jgi:hypothetical protein
MNPAVPVTNIFIFFLGLGTERSFFDLSVPSLTAVPNLIQQKGQHARGALRWSFANGAYVQIR